MAEDNTEKVVSRRKPKDPSESKQGKNYLLVIAINEYQHCKPLRNTVKDAKDFIEILTTKYQFEKDNLFTLFDKDATRKNILKQFKELKKLIKAENKDNLIIYFSGHGEHENNIGYWIPVEAEVGEEDEYISTSDIINRLSIIPTLHTYLIVDACFSGALFPTYKGGIKAGHEKKASRWGLTASHTRELAHDGQLGENSPFAKYLLKKLLENKGTLSVPELNAYVLREVAFNTTPRQTPIGQPIAIKGHDNGHFIFHPRRSQDISQETTSEEESDWQAALIRNTISSFSAFRRKYKSSVYRTEALERIEQLEEEKDWQTALRRNKISGFERYLDDHPKGKYIKEAEEKIKVLGLREEDGAFSRKKVEENLWEKYKKVFFVGSYHEGIVLRLDQRGAVIQLPYDLEAFAPIKHIRKVNNELAEVNEVLTVKVIEVNEHDKNIVVSHLRYLEDIYKEAHVQVEKERKSKSTLVSELDAESPIIISQPQQKIDDLIFIKGGSYEMGDVLGDGIEDAPPHTVSVPDFYLAPHTVTFEEYDEYCEATNKKKPDDRGWGRGKRPVIYVSWYDALEYCNWKSKANGLPPVYTLRRKGAKVKVNWQGKGYRLPTEAEWEYAAREGGKKVRFGNGKNEAKPDEINFNKSGHYKTMPVGSYAPNVLGLYDMSGNVWERCWDVYDNNYYYESRGAHHPKGPNSGDSKVLRGGSWDFNDLVCRVSYRLNWYHINRVNNIGFRIARYSVK